MAMEKPRLAFLLYAFLVAAFVLNCHAHERKVYIIYIYICSLYICKSVSVLMFWVYVYIGSHCVHGRAASRGVFCSTVTPFYATFCAWKVSCQLY